MPRRGSQRRERGETVRKGEVAHYESVLIHDHREDNAGRAKSPTRQNKKKCIRELSSGEGNEKVEQGWHTKRNRQYSMNRGCACVSLREREAHENKKRKCDYV